jgi:hypothetical protein
MATDDMEWKGWAGGKGQMEVMRGADDVESYSEESSDGNDGGEEERV